MPVDANALFMLNSSRLVSHGEPYDIDARIVGYLPAVYAFLGKRRILSFR